MPAEAVDKACEKEETADESSRWLYVLEPSAAKPTRERAVRANEEEGGSREPTPARAMTAPGVVSEAGWRGGREADTARFSTSRPPRSAADAGGRKLRASTTGDG